MTWGVTDLSVAFGATIALEGASLPAQRGTIAAVVGGDGAGKTTLLRCLAGALAPSSGRVERPAKHRIGYLSGASATYPDLTVDENLEFCASVYGIPAARARERARTYLSRMGLAGAGGRLAGQLSGGMRQKLGAVCALLHQPDLLILDEPTTGLDPVSRADLWWLFAQAARDGSAVVLSTTYLDEAERASLLLVLDAGLPVATGSPASIIAATPGSVWSVGCPPPAADAGRAWQQGPAWRLWQPAGARPVAGGTQVAASLQDAVIVAALAHHPDQPGSGDNPPPAVPAPSSGPLATAVGVTHRFGDSVAVDGVDLAVAPGEVVGLIGANGAGKTTLIRLLLGLLTPSEGQAQLFGQPPSRETRRRLGYMAQGLGLYSDLSPAENLAFSTSVFGVGAPLPQALARYATTPVGRLPLGVQRRVAFAQALAHQPELLILDEPTSGVDALSRARLWEQVHAAAAQGVGVVVTTHHFDEAAECDRLVIMAAGRVVAEGTAADIIGPAQATVVDAEDWTAALAALEEAGLWAALVGRTLRVLDAGPEVARRALGSVPASVWQVPATLEERFFQLARVPVGAP